MGHKIIVLEITDEHYNNLLLHIAQNGNLLDADISDDDNTPAPVGASSVDDRGVPWHASYHTPKKTKLNDGSFRRVKGVDKAAADAYEAPFLNATPTMPGVAVAAPVAPVAPAVAMPGLPGLPVAAPVLQMPVATPVPAPVTFEQVCALFAEKLSSNKITPDHIGAIYAEAGVDPANVNELSTDETKRANLAAILNRFA